MQENMADAPSQGAGVPGNAALALDNVVNLRDLGGLATRDGYRVRAGKLFRSGNPGLASAADMERLRALQLDMVIDFLAVMVDSGPAVRTWSGLTNS